MRVVWITGMPRSGTSWLGKIFASHPEVLYHFEPFDDKPERKSLDKELKFFNLVEKIKEVEPEREPVRQNMLSVALHRFWGYSGHELDRRPFFPQPDKPRMMVIKSPKVMPIIETCAHFGQVICIVRDPRAMVASLWRTEFGKSYPAKGTAQRWVRWGEKFLDLEEKWPESFRCLRFEQLALEPEMTAKALAEWVDLPWAKEMKSFIRWSRETHDPHVYAVQKSSERALNQWRMEISEAAEKTILNEVLKSRPWESWYRGVL